METPQHEELDLTVQYYRPEHTDAGPSLTQGVFDDATRLVMSIQRDVRWYNPSRSNTLSFAIGEHCFQWNREVPEVKNRQHVPGSRAIAEWDEDVAVQDDELWALPSLEEFDHSRLRRLLDLQLEPPLLNRTRGDEVSVDRLNHQAAPASSMTIGRKRSSERDSDSLAMQATKRLKLDESSLRDVIPEPHFFHSRATTDDPDYQPLSLKLQYCPIPPHTLASVTDYMRDPYARLAWIVPVRGRPQWTGATAASVLASSHHPSSPVSDDQLPSISTNSSISELMWTRDALNELWATLKNLRQCERFGPLSLCFHVAMPAALTSSMEQYSYVGSHKQTTISMSTSLSSNLSTDERSMLNTGSPLHAVDYIKVYHDAKYTTGLRAVLRAWSYKKAGQKCRLLKEAKLVLVDELSRGLVIC